jgi:lipopolysaccharide transport system ATP-binding protein
VAKQGSPEEVMDCYNALLAERESAQIAQIKTEAGKMQTISGTGEARLEKILLLNKLDEPVEVVNVGEFVTLRITVRANADIPRLVLGYMIKDRLGQPIFGTNTHHTNQALESIVLGETVIYRISFPMNFGPGSYSIATSLHSTDTHLVKNYEWKDLALIFTVLNQDKDVFVGTSWAPPNIEIMCKRI